MALRFDGQVVIVTGAGQGLGKAYALDFAKRGAKVVINDLGGSASGSGASKVADIVVAEIKAAGGEAVANYDSVVDGDKIVKTAIDAFGRVDVVVNNAGILRDQAFHKMTDEAWDIINAVHVKGAYKVTRAAWPYMREQKYGRIIFVASAAGLFGNFGQANYSTAKLGLVGFGNTLAVEGKKFNILTNTIAPLAKSRMTEKLMPPAILEQLGPECVSPVVQYLCHSSSTNTGGVYECGAGWVAKVRFQRSAGVVMKDLTPESAAAVWDEVLNYDNATYPTTPRDTASGCLSASAKAKAKAKL